MLKPPFISFVEIVLSDDKVFLKSAKFPTFLEAIFPPNIEEARRLCTVLYPRSDSFIGRATLGHGLQALSL